MAKRLKLENLTKSSIWTVSEQDLCQMLTDARLHDTPADEMHHYMNIIRPVFDVQYLYVEDKARVEQLKAEHYEIFCFHAKQEEKEADQNAEKEQEGEKEMERENDKVREKPLIVAVRKREIRRITDLTVENVQHLSAADVLGLIERNLGTGWGGLSLAIQDIILSAFYVDSSTMPEAMLHRKGGIVERRKADGYDVLEIARGSWIEAIFLKMKPKTEKVRFSSGINELGEEKGDNYDEPAEDEEEDDMGEDEDLLDEEEHGEDEEVTEEDETAFEDLDVIDEDSLTDDFVDADEQGKSDVRGQFDDNYAF